MTPEPVITLFSDISPKTTETRVIDNVVTPDVWEAGALSGEAILGTPFSHKPVKCRFLPFNEE